MKNRRKIFGVGLGLALVLISNAGAGTPADRGGLFFGRAPDPEKSHRYFIAAEPVMWDYAPGGKDEICGATLPPSVVAERQVMKLRYVQYTDASFTTKVRETPSLGILGPVLRGVVGDFLVVTFLNRSSQPLSMHPHGVRYDKDSEGTKYQSGTGRGGSVEPGAQFTYVWQLDAASGPGPDEPSSKGWLYHSHVAGDDEINQGLIGVILVTDPKRARPDGTPADVDRELATLFLIFDESGLGAEEREAYEYVDNGSGIPTRSWAETQEILERGSRSAINGRVFGNLPGLAMNEGERVRWYLFGLGSERDFHTAHWHGQRVIEDGRRRTDVIELMPASMKVADLVADNPGDWVFHCHVADHMREGMFARLTVYPKDAIGVDRSPGRAFLGVNETNASLRFARAEISPITTLGSRESAKLSMEGEATVFEAFSVFNQPVRVQLGEKAVTFSPDRTGTAQTAEGNLRIKNAGATGVVYGGIMEFEIGLSGPEWLAQLKRLDALDPGRSALAGGIPVTMEIGSARHTARLQLKATAASAR